MFSDSSWHFQANNSNFFRCVFYWELSAFVQIQAEFPIFINVLGSQCLEKNQSTEDKTKIAVDALLKRACSSMMVVFIGDNTF